jgi:hypothetical protein
MNGWQRVGVIVSVLWILIAGFHAYDASVEFRTNLAVTSMMSCEATYKTGLSNQCDSRLTQGMEGAYSDAWAASVIIGLTLVPFAWASAYLSLFLVRWVRYGFNQTARVK